MNAVVAVGGVLGVALAVLLFFFLPAVLFNGLMVLTGRRHQWLAFGV